ncbi:MAG: hypothetical protein AAF224_02180 [Pseudomonadota bacterium]
MSGTDLSDVLTAFFADPGDAFAELGPALEPFGYRLLDDHKGLEGLLPRPDLTPGDCFVWRTAFENAPFLILSRTDAPTQEGRDGRLVFVQRRVWLMEIPEERGRAFVDKAAGGPPAETLPQEGGARAHIWTLPAAPPVLQDGYRLFVAADQEALILDRIAMVRA